MKRSFFANSAFLLLAAMGLEAATITGTVKTGSGTLTPVEGAKVLLRSIRGNGGEQDSTVTNADGAFSLSTTSTGFRLLQVSKTGFQNSQTFIDIASANGTYTSAIVLTAVAPPAAPGSVTGIIKAGTSTGAVIAGAQIIISKSNGGNGLIPVDTVSSNAQGIYTFPSIPAANNYTVRARASGYNDATDNNVDVDANTTTTSNLIMILTPPPPPPGTITGTVRATSATGTLIVAARLILSTPANGDLLGKAIDTVYTNDQGVYLINPVPAANNYILTVSKVGFDPGTNTNVDVLTAAATTVNFILVVNPDAGKPGSIAGTVRKNDSTAMVISGALIMLSRSGIKVDSTKTSAEGRYSFASVEALQNYSITVSAGGYNSSTNNNVDVSANTTTTTDFKLDITGVSKTMGTIMGLVSNAAGQGIPNATVIIFRSQGTGTRDTTKTDATGHYGMDSILAGTAYTVAVSGANFQNAINSNVNVLAGQTVVADFILVASTSLFRNSSAWKSGLRLSEMHGVRSIEFSAMPSVGRLSGYAANGSLRFTRLTPAYSNNLVLPAQTGLNYLVLERAGEIQKVIVPIAR